MQSTIRWNADRKLSLLPMVLKIISSNHSVTDIPPTTVQNLGVRIGNACFETSLTIL